MAYVGRGQVQTAFDFRYPGVSQKTPLLRQQAIQNRVGTPIAKNGTIVRLDPQSAGPTIMKITIFGAGYVGLATAACLADAGHQVMCAENDPAKLALLRQGKSPIFEPGLERLLACNIAAQRLHFTDSPEQAVSFGELLFIAVGTPANEDGSANLNYVMQVAESIGRHMDSPRIVVNKSTVPVGTAEKVAAHIAKTQAQNDRSTSFEVCSNPEFLKEGSALKDFTRGPRIIIGTSSEHVRQKMRECYAPYNRKRDKIIFMDARSAELTKYAANAMLATRISFMNEMASLAELLNADIEQVRTGIDSDPRIGDSFLYAGCGYGGSCFPKDIRPLRRLAAQAGHPPEILQALETANHRQQQQPFNKRNNAPGGQPHNPTNAVWGLAFKPGTDDMREAPSRALIDSLVRAGARVQAYDPAATPTARTLWKDQPGVTLCHSREQAVSGAHALVICTEWKQFRAVDFNWLKSQLKTATVIDGRNLYPPEEITKSGIRYISIGRPVVE